MQDVSFKVSSLNQQGLFAGYASVFENIDDQNDIILPGAFKQSLDKWDHQRKLPKMLWQHDMYEPIGRWLLIEEDQKGLYVEGQLLLEVQKAKEAYSLMKARAVDGLSIGYRVINSLRDQQTDVRKISQLDLLEISVVTFAANQQARIITIKAEKN